MNGWFTSFDRRMNSVENNLQELTQAIRAWMQAQSRASDSSVQVPIEFNVLKEFIENDLPSLSMTYLSPLLYDLRYFYQSFNKYPYISIDVCFVG